MTDENDRKAVSPVRVDIDTYNRLEMLRAAFSAGEGKIVSRSEITNRAIEALRRHPETGVDISTTGKVGGKTYGKLTCQMPSAWLTWEQIGFINNHSAANFRSISQVIRDAYLALLNEHEEGLPEIQQPSQ